MPPRARTRIKVVVNEKAEPVNTVDEITTQRRTMAWVAGGAGRACEDVAIYVDLAVKRSRSSCAARRAHLTNAAVASISRREASRGCGLTARLRKICTIHVPTQR